MRVALIYPDTVVLKILAEVFSGEGYEVDSFDTGAAAIPTLLAGGFNAAICGVHLPDMTAEQLLVQAIPLAHPALAARYVFLDNAPNDASLAAFLYGRRRVSLPVHLTEILAHIDAINALC